ncbi:UNVERIFIED_CONTAM: glycerol-3-phosphate acyltransferase PlsY [Acetivibrio alkalicellulosi]
MEILVLMILVVFLIGYLLGSINTSLVVGKFYGVDVRKHGSGNAGMTNTLRTIGKMPAVFVIVGDILKGILACIIGYYILRNFQTIEGLGTMVAGLGAIIGHNWPLYFGFKGGKGVLTTFAVIMMMQPYVGLMLLAVFVIILLITKYVSLGSIIAAGLFPIISIIIGKGVVFSVFAAIIGILVIIRHVKNIERLISKTESKFGSKKA